MRKLNSKFKTNFISEPGTLLQNKDYFGYVELDDYACYVIADGIDDALEIESAQIAVTSIIRNFTEKPSMNKRHIKKILEDANEDLIMQSREVRLKASLTLIITDYSKIRYAAVGNTRFYLFRTGFLRYKSEDQSLTSILSQEEDIPLDKISKHNERNNLYCYLGQNKLNNPYISKKIKLIDGDIIALGTRGIWENIDEQEITDAIDGAKDSKELTDSIEDMLLSKQLKNIENYTLAVTYVDKVYIEPNKKAWIKKALFAAIPILIVLIIGLIIWNINRNKKIDNINLMNNHKANAVEYAQNGNIPKSNEEYKLALDIANKYKLKPEKLKLDNWYKHTELILDADGKLKDKKYEEALEKYLLALDKSNNIDNIAEKYVLEKLETTRNSIKVMDLMNLGDKNLELGNIADAEVSYKQAKNLATDYYLNDERKEAMGKLEKIYAQKADAEKEAKENTEKEKKAEEDKKKEALQTEDKAVEHIKKGDISYSAGDYISAKMYYIMAKQMYKEVGSTEVIAKDLESKIQLMDKKISEASNKRAKADRYEKDGDERYIKGEYSSAKVLYQLAKDIYENEGLTEEAKKVQGKLEASDRAVAKQ